MATTTSTTIIDEDNVTTVSTDIETWLTRSLLPRTLTKGTYGMKQAGNEFLLQHTLETDIAYKRRLKQSTLLNAYRKTCSFLSGQVFQKDVEFSDAGVDPVYIDWSKEIDSSGNDLDVFAKRVFQNGLAKGVSHILVDVPESNPEIVTQADEAEAGIRPYFKEIRPEDIKAAIVDENGFLVQLRIAETVTRRVGKYGTETVDMIRVLEPGTWQLWEIIDGDYPALVKEGTFSINAIPLVTFIPGEEWTIVTGETPLMDLAELNRKHWQSSSDQDNILSVARVPILLGVAIEIEKMPVGTSTMVTSDDAEARLEYVEHSGAAIEAGASDLKETEAQMGLYGLQQLLPRSGNQTATEKAISSSESSSSLGTWTTEFESVLVRAFQVAGLFFGKEFPADGIKLNKDFSYGLSDSQELAQLISLYEKGILSAQATFAECKRRGVVVESLTWEENQDEKTQEVRETPDFEGLAGATFGEEV